MMPDGDTVANRDVRVQVGIERRRDLAVGADMQLLPDATSPDQFHRTKNQRATPYLHSAQAIQRRPYEVAAGARQEEQRGVDKAQARVQAVKLTAQRVGYPPGKRSGRSLCAEIRIRLVRLPGIP